MMEVHTKLKILNCRREKICTYKTPKLTGITKRKDIENFIVKKCKNFKPPFDIQIFDEDNDFVTLDDDYLEDYNPFKAKTIDTTTVQPTNSSIPTVIVQIIVLNYASNFINDEEFMKTEEGIQKNENIQQIDQSVSVTKSQIYPIIRLSNDSKMGFIPNNNVNSEQRDQYPCDRITVSTGDIVRTLSMIQAPKDSTKIHKSVLPRFRIWHDDIKNRSAHVWTLLVFIILDVYQSGKRSLFYHSQRAFVEKDNVKQSLNPYKIPIINDDWMSNMGVELKLITVVIEGAKKHPDTSLNILCQFEDTIENKLLDTSHNYSKSRLALILQKDDVIQWDTLVLSNEMIFKKRITTSGTANILDISTNATSTPLKRNSSKKRRIVSPFSLSRDSNKKYVLENTSNQRSKRTKKIRKEEDPPSISNPFTNNNDSPIYLHQDLPVYYNNSQVIGITSQTMLNISSSDSELLSDLPQTNYLSGNSININNNYPDIFNNFDYTNADDNMLNANPLLCDTAYSDIDLLNL
ncbi:unnamed protein product [Rotaria sordida]|uniref:Uncharacterized protein n=1 Tax=Rotaria sordida TaxID=392033 RepID=A0A818KR11_9BILA|nr:unnamed protein product [Rotaria sordida]